jgi:hypothetical protein
MLRIYILRRSSVKQTRAHGFVSIMHEQQRSTQNAPAPTLARWCILEESDDFL